MATNSSPLLGLPDDLLQRVLVGVPLEDHDAAAAACGAFRAVIRGPRFLRLRREFGFAERAVLLLSGRFRINQDESIDGCLEIHAAQKRGFAESFFEHKVSIIESTTDGAARIFFCTNVKTGNEILVMDASTCRWSRFATLPQNQKGQCMLWHGSGLLYVADGRIVAFYHDGAAFERANDGSWSPYQAVADVDALDHRSLACFGSVLLG